MLAGSHCSWGAGSRAFPAMGEQHCRRKERTRTIVVMETEQGKPVSPPFGEGS